MYVRILHGGHWGSGRVLFAGLGGLLILMGLAGADALLALRQAKATSADMRRVFLARSRSLDEIRSRIYVSLTLARDYLLAADSAAAEEQRAKLRAIQRETDDALDGYARSLSQAESETFRSLLAEIHAYWKVLDLMTGPDLEHRRGRSAAYFYGQLVQRRAAMLDLANRIAHRNEQEIASSDQRLDALFDSFRLRLALILAITLSGGLALASVTASRLLKAQRELEQLSSRLVSAQEEERRSISRELHDEVGQSLTALAMEAGAAASMHADGPDLRERLQSIQRMAEASMGAVRNLALLLRPSMLDDLGLVPALRWQAREMTKRTGIKVRVTAEDIASDLNDEQNTCIYRVVQEALNNAVRHAQARTVHVKVCGAGGNVHLNIKDDGDGFDTHQTRGMGLVGMAERVRNAGGELRIESSPGLGTTLQVLLPFQAKKTPPSVA